ncbi:hypothetical protein AB7M17_003961 [Bradyrhizobium sp. USDA 377]
MTNQLSDLDRDALTRAIVYARGESEARSRQIDRMFAERPWEDVAKFCAYNSQIRTLHLSPMQDPPMYAGLRCGDARYVRANIALLQQMLAAGLSRFEPDVEVALEHSRRRQSV